MIMTNMIDFLFTQMRYTMYSFLFNKKQKVISKSDDYLMNIAELSLPFIEVEPIS